LLAAYEASVAQLSSAAAPAWRKKGAALANRVLPSVFVFIVCLQGPSSIWHVS